MGVTFIQQRGAGLLDRRTDARRVRDRKFDRLHDLYVDVAASAQLRHETLQGIIEADARIAARKAGKAVAPTISDDSQLREAWENASARVREMRARLVVETDAQDVRSAYEALAAISADYVFAGDMDTERNSQESWMRADEALDRLERTIRGSIDALQAAVDD
jgi:hypothetical protein